MTADPLPCPCCGSADLYVGPHTAQSFGVQCRNCGLRIGRGLPKRFPKGVRDLPIDDAMRAVQAISVQAAVEAWNLRAPAVLLNPNEE